MALYSISGVGCCDNCESGYIGGRKRRATRRAKRRERKTRLYCKGANVKRVGLSVPRNAFLSLVKLNVKKIAVKLYANLQDPNKKRALFKKWCKLGGDAKKLESAVVKAYNKYARKKGRKIGYMDMEGQIGSIATLIATATPIIKALLPFLKQVAPGSTITETAEGLTSEQPAEQSEQPTEQTDGESVGQIQINPYVVGGGLLLAYLIFKKK